MNKPNKKDSLNLVFSAFLILGYIVCSYFFLNMSATMPDLAPYINILVFTVFGLVIFYATRVGEGKPVKRFSLWTLIILDIPALYIILAQLIEGLPLHTAIANQGELTPLDYSPLLILACIALGYGIPYTFLSGYEMASDNEQADMEAEASEEIEAEDETQAVAAAGRYVAATADTEGALMVVDDLDFEFDAEKEIRISDVDPANEWAKVGSFVVYAQDASEEDGTEENEANEAE